MPYEKTIARVQAELVETFRNLDSFFDLPPNVRAFHVADDAWSIDQILEHITLTNHFLMLTLRRNRDIVLKRAKSLSIPDGESDLDEIVQVSDPDAFAWVRPEHMEPTGEPSSGQVRDLLQAQCADCLHILTDINGGEGALHTVRMSVQALGRLDMYQWLYFLVQHARRHGIEIKRIQQQFSTVQQRD